MISHEEQLELDELPKPQEVLLEFAPKNEALEEDTILLEVPKVEEDGSEKNVKQSKLSLHEHVLLLGFLNHLHCTTPTDEVLQEQTQAYLDLMLDVSNDWLVYSKGLLLRSLNEFSRLKKMQRALMQLQTLVDQNNDRAPDFESRIRMYFCVKYPHYFALNKILAQYWMKAGGMQSGYEIFARLGMLDECIECLVGMGENQRAIAEINKMPTLSPKTKCILAELTQDIDLLQQVWHESKLARAQRSLADLYFFKFKDYQKAADALRLALSVNSYHANSWFVMGCAYMRLNKLNEAVQALSKAVSVDESNAEGWANLSGCLQMMG